MNYENRSQPFSGHQPVRSRFTVRSARLQIVRCEVKMILLRREDAVRSLGSRNLNISKGSATAPGDHDRICIMRHNVPGRLSTHVPFECAGAALTGHTPSAILD